MTKQEAKQLTLKVWRYLMWHPWVEDKRHSPFWEQIKLLDSNCPLCELFREDNLECKDCPIYRPYTDEDGTINCECYALWYHSKTFISRFINAARIVSRVKRWEV